jgi:hypothetical protein
VYAEFLCESGAADCSETASVTPAAVEGVRRTGRWVLAPGHTLSPGREAQARAAAAREDARALQAQSAQQIRRARRNFATARVDVGRESPETPVVLMSADSDGLAAAGRSAHAVAVLDKADLLPATLDEIWLQHGPDRRD